MRANGLRLLFWLLALSLRWLAETVVKVLAIQQEGTRLPKFSFSPTSPQRSLILCYFRGAGP